MEEKEIKKQGSIDEEWAMIEEVIKEAAQETLVEEKTERRQEWFDEECRQAIEEKDRARAKMLQKETRSNMAKYKILRKKAHKICKQKKKAMYETRIQEIEELHQKGELRKFYRAMDRIKKGFNQEWKDVINVVMLILVSLFCLLILMYHRDDLGIPCFLGTPLGGLIYAEMSQWLE